MNINIEDMTDLDLLKLAKIGAEAVLKAKCQHIADTCASSRNINELRILIQKFDGIDAALDELQHREE